MPNNGFHYGLGTHFNDGVEADRLATVATRFTSARIDAQTSTPEQARQWIEDCTVAGLHPITIFDTPEQQEALPDGIWVELQNEVNIGLGRPAPIHPDVYRESIEKAYNTATRKGQTLCAGAAANMERRDIQWFHDLRFRDLPSDIIAVTHHYVPRDRFRQAHHINRWNPLTWTRQYEVDAFRAAIGLDREWIITEFGYKSGPHDSLTPDDAAGEIAQEWPFWAKQPGCLGAWLYQIRDSPVDDHDFGLYDEHDQIKQAIFETVPVRTPNQEIDMLEVHHALRRKDAIKHPTRQGYFTSPHPDNDGTVLCVEYDTGNGRHYVAKRPAGTAGAWETWRDDGTIAVFEDTAGGAAAILLVD
jgi:hypothetical protein